jgi:hypothetical protein
VYAFGALAGAGAQIPGLLDPDRASSVNRWFAKAVGWRSVRIAADDELAAPPGHRVV